MLIALHDGERRRVRRHAPAVRRRDVPRACAAGPRGSPRKRGARAATRRCASLPTRSSPHVARHVRRPRARSATAFERVRARARFTRFGGDCYAYCLLAMGLIDVVVEAGLQAWDIQALVPIVEGAGGVGHRVGRRSLRRRRRRRRVRRPVARAAGARAPRRALMRFLVLGGTRFLGRHLVDAAIERGHTVTTFTRGQSPTHEHPAVLPLGGDRDPGTGAGLAALRVRYVGRGVRHERLRAAHRRRIVRPAGLARAPLRVRVVAVGLRGHERAGRHRGRAAHARSTIRRPRTSRSTTAR